MLAIVYLEKTIVQTYEKCLEATVCGNAEDKLLAISRCHPLLLSRVWPYRLLRRSAVSGRVCKQPLPSPERRTTI